MSKSLRKLLYIAIGVIGIPFILYLAIQINGLDEDEKILEQIYNRQLEAVLFSLNQYSDDVVSAAAEDIEGELQQIIESAEGLNPHTTFRPTYFIHLRAARNDSVRHWRSFTDLDVDLWEHLADSIFNENEILLDRLISYKETGFRKIEPLGSIIRDQMEYALLLYILESNNELWFCLTAIEPELFAETVLSPKMQEVAREDFVVVVRNTTNQSIVYSTDSLRNTEFSSRPLWLVPHFEIAIAPTGKTVQEIIKERTTVNLFIGITLGVLMLFGFWLVFTNLKREMILAQNKSDFVSNVSHEIRTPLSLISMFAETLLMNRVKDEEKKRTYYDIIQKESARLTRIINRILDFSQIEADKKNYKKEGVSVNDIVEQVVDTYSFHLDNKGFAFSVSCDNHLPDIQADRESLIEAVINLLDNAMKYSDLVKNIDLKTGQEGDFVYISVEDKGIGIDHKKKKQIFEKFYRVTTDNVHDTKGVGLGLSLVKHIMDAHNGKIELESKLGAGSKFRMLFPLPTKNKSDE